MTKFEGIVPALASALEARGYETLTPVQQSVIDPSLGDADVLVSAQTGSGKTVAFGLAMAPTLLGEAERFDQARLPLALAIAPTRELAMQVKRELEWLYAPTGATIASCVGGMDMRSERRVLERGAHIVVGTPGRLRDHITRGGLDMSELRAVVLDEADEMLDLGFREDLEFILDAAPAQRRTLMFSATVPPAIAKLAKSYQRNAVRISTAAEAKQHLDIEYRALTVAPSDRENAIINVLRYYDAKNALVFCSTRAAVNHLTARFNNRGFAVVAMSGELSQNERTHALQAMRDGRAKVCIATDVAARGIDLPNLDLVVHADLPTNPETLLHRSGRTGRAGRKGVSVLIVPTSGRRRADRLLQNASITAEWARPPSADEIVARDDERLLADPVFEQPADEAESSLVAALLERHGADRVAVAFVRMSRAGKSAPEDLIELQAFSAPTDRRSDRDAPAGPREEFGESVWFSISAGRRQNAEPRWLIPMLCRVGKITKAEIGAIKMQPEETYVQIAAHVADSFMKAVGPERELQNGIMVARLDGTPDLGRGGGKPPASKPYKKSFGDKRFDGPRPAKSGYPKKEASADQSADHRPWTKKGPKGGAAKTGGPKPGGAKKAKAKRRDG
ncbi:DEAD/DEAH box helicase [Mesorhizobium sp. CAU 1741]|uniref:DEAD/DEAH box helicase n=1 Tax=Mesorhizobium sp. CAU 1741 TaxID=3140366 RepID=UPI00325C18B7